MLITLTNESNATSRSIAMVIMAVSFLVGIYLVSNSSNILTYYYWGSVSIAFFAIGVVFKGLLTDPYANHDYYRIIVLAGATITPAFGTAGVAAITMLHNTGLSGMSTPLDAIVGVLSFYFGVFLIGMFLKAAVLIALNKD